MVSCFSPILYISVEAVWKVSATISGSQPTEWVHNPTEQYFLFLGWPSLPNGWIVVGVHHTQLGSSFCLFFLVFVFYFSSYWFLF